MPEPKDHAKKPSAPDDSLMHSFKDSTSTSTFMSKSLIIMLVIGIVLGVGTGYLLAQNGGKTGIGTIDKAANSAKIKPGQILGSDDTDHYKDTAEGEVKIGGVGDEGSHSLIRPGGESQTVCMTSSLVDLDSLKGRKIKVWGETNTAKTCGWLMDVGRVQVVE